MYTTAVQGAFPLQQKNSNTTAFLEVVKESNLTERDKISFKPTTIRRNRMKLAGKLQFSTYKFTETIYKNKHFQFNLTLKP